MNENNEKLLIDQFQRQIITENNMMRKEKMLILPYNTLRIFDFMVQVDLEKVKDPNWKGQFEDVLRKVVTRTERDMGKFNGIDSDMVNRLMYDSWMHYYELAPRTNLYGMIETLSQQNFMNDIIVLFHKQNCKEEEYTNAYYDGTIEGLEKFINENEITALVMDDVELLMTLINRGNVPLDWKTIFISKLGYNYYRHKESGALLMKHSLEFTSKYTLEVASLGLI